MAISKVNMYWKGVFYAAGSECPEDAPKSLIEQSEVKPNADKKRKLKLQTK